jgi:hypothetical protein
MHTISNPTKHQLALRNARKNVEKMLIVTLWVDEKPANAFQSLMEILI